MVLDKNQLLAMAPEAIMALPDWFVIKFDDGEQEVCKEHTFFSRFYWKFHQEFTKIPLLKSHHLTNVLKGADYGSDSHLRLCEAIQDTILKNYDYWNEPINRKIAKMVKHITNDMTNGMTMFASSYVSTITLEEVIYVMRHPRIVEVLDKMDKGEATPEDAYAVGHDVLMNDPVVTKTGLGIAYRGGTIKRNQCLQIVVSVGIRTEADGTIFNWAVRPGYGEGITDIAELAADAQAAPKALASTEGPIQDSDYLSRRLKFVAKVVQNIDPTDCGSSRTILWYILPEVRDENNNVTQKSGLRGLIGRYYFNEEGELTRIDGTEKHLEGTHINLRDIQKCDLHNEHNVCRICFGDLWYNVQECTNLGFSCVAAFMELIIQLTLSTKHVVGSAVGEGVRIPPEAKRYFKVGKRKNCYYLNSLLKKMKLRIVIPHDYITGLDTLKLADMDNVAASLISRIQRIRLMFVEEGVEQGDPVELKQGSRDVFMTQEFIQYALKKGWTINADVNYEFDMSEWDFSLGVFSLPEKEMSFAERGTEIGKKIESNMEEMTHRYNPDSPAKTLAELAELVGRSLDIPLSCLSVLIYANMIAGPGDYRLARHSPTPVMGVARQVIQNRSLANALSFETLTDIVFNPRSFFPNGRPDSEMDVFFDPKAVVERFQRETIT